MIGTQAGAALIRALVAARANFPAITKQHTAKIRSDKGAEFTYAYATLDDLIEATRGPLAAEGLIAVQDLGSTEQGYPKVRTILLHVSGERLESSWFEIPPTKADPRGYGIAVTYARRISYGATLGLFPEPDTDGDDPGARAKAARQARETAATTRRAAPAKSTTQPPAPAAEAAQGAATEAAEGALSRLEDLVLVMGEAAAIPEAAAAMNRALGEIQKAPFAPEEKKKQTERFTSLMAATRKRLTNPKGAQA